MTTPDPRRSWWDELETPDGPVALRVRAVGGHVRVVAEVGPDRVDVQLPASVAAELGRALVAAATAPDEAAVAGGEVADGAAGPTPGPSGTGPPPPIEPWAAPLPDAAACRRALEQALTTLRRLAGVLPETVEVDTLGDPSFRVATRMFAVVETVDGVPVVRFKASLVDQAALIEAGGYRPDPETGHHGWTARRLDDLTDHAELEEVVVASYRLVAPPDVVALLDAALGEP